MVADSKDDKQISERWDLKDENAFPQWKADTLRRFRQDDGIPTGFIDSNRPTEATQIGALGIKRARSPAWLATSAAEHAVSYATQVPCSLSVYESRPAAIATDEPVATAPAPGPQSFASCSEGRNPCWSRRGRLR